MGAAGSYYLLDSAFMGKEFHGADGQMCIRDRFKALEKKLNHDLDRDLDYFSSDIKKMIATEIIKRYYYQRGNIIQQLKDDDGLKEAMKILNAQAKYKEMLSAPAAKE